MTFESIFSNSSKFEQIFLTPRVHGHLSPQKNVFLLKMGLERETAINMKVLKRSNSGCVTEAGNNAGNAAKEVTSSASLCDSDEVEHILQSQGTSTMRMGTNIVPRNPDVEIAALVLKDVPVTPESFRELAKDNDWYRFPFMVLQVGPPGFSTVPYTSTKKKGEKDENGQPLYESGSSSHTNVNYSTMFHTFEKGKTNKDRGKRVSLVSMDNDNNGNGNNGNGNNGNGNNGNAEDNDSLQNVTVSMQAGQCMAHFLRSDDFGGRFFVDGAETLNKMRVVPAYSVVYLQVSSANVDQAKNGRILKFKRMKVIPSQKEVNEVLAATIPNLPINTEEFRTVNMCSNAKNWALRENMEKANLCLTANKVGKNAFVTDDDSAVLVQMAEGGDVKNGTSGNAIHAVVDENCITNVLPNASRRDCLKFLNIAIAAGAVKALMRSNMQGDVVMDCNGEGFVFKVVAFVVDVNVVLALDVFEEILLLEDVWGDINDPGSLMSSNTYSNTFGNGDKLNMTMLRGTGGDFLWSNDAATIFSDGKKHRVVFRMPSLEPSMGDAGLPESLSFVGKGCSGPFHEVQVLVVEESKFKVAAEGVRVNGNESLDLSKLGAHCMSLELRPGNRGGSGTKFKRMRLF